MHLICASVPMLRVEVALMYHIHGHLDTIMACCHHTAMRVPAVIKRRIKSGHGVLAEFMHLAGCNVQITHGGRSSARNYLESRGTRVHILQSGEQCNVRRVRGWTGTARAAVTAQQ